MEYLAKTIPARSNNRVFHRLINFREKIEKSPPMVRAKAKYNAIPLSLERVEYLRFRQNVKKTLNYALGREPSQFELDSRIRQLKMSPHRERMALI